MSLVTVMAGVSLVGYSGSLIKDTAPREETNNLLTIARAFAMRDGAPLPEEIEDPQVTKVLIGMSI